MGRLKLLHFGFGAPQLFITNSVHMRSQGEGFQNSLRNVASHQGLAYLVSPQIGELWKVLVMLKNPYLRQNKWNGYKNSKNGHYNAYINFSIKDYSTEEVDVWQQCVGYPGIKVLTTRSQKIKIKYQIERKFHDVEEEVKGFAAKVMQQAYDHLQAIDPLAKAKDLEIISQQLQKQHGANIKNLLSKFSDKRNSKVQQNGDPEENNIYRRSRQFNQLRRQIMYCITDFYRK